MNSKIHFNKINSFKYTLIFIIFFNIYLLNALKTSIYDQVLNIMVSFGLLNFYNESKFIKIQSPGSAQIISTFFILFLIFYRSFWLHISDNFIYLLLPFLYILFILISNKLQNIFNHLSPIFISFLLPISKILFIPLSIIINPISTFFTWLSLNTLGFYSVMKGQEIFYNNHGINVTFSCSGSGQILFCLSAMIILYFCFPLKNIRLFFVQLFASFVFTFSVNIIRLFILTIFSYKAHSPQFSIFDYLHGGTGGLFFSFFSMIISCELYKRLYLRYPSKI